MRRDADITGAFRWVTQPSNPKTRGQRVVAFQIATQGPNAVDGASTIKEAAGLRGIAESQIHAMLGDLRARFGLVVPYADFAEPRADFERERRQKVGAEETTVEGVDFDAA